MKIYTPYLVQRARVKPEPRHNKKISENLEMDYMGSAEFEFGALPNSIRQIYNDLDLYHTIQVKEIKNEKNQPLIIWSKIPFEFLPEYVEHLKQMRLGKLHLKESSYFDVACIEHFPSLAERVNFWWDLDNHVMFSFKPAIMKVLADSITESVKYMDEQQKNKE